MSGLQLVKLVDALTIVGPGVASGGLIGQVLTKKSGDNYDTEWKDVALAVSPAERAAAGERVWVSGYSVSGGPSAAVQAAIDALVALGWPLESVLWDDLGEQSAISTLTIQDCVSSSSASNVVLVQTGGSFAIAGCVSASTAENVTISNPDLLLFVVQDSASTSSADNLALVQSGGVFTIADSTSASTAGNITLISDATAPTVTTFTAGTPSGSTVPITAFTATDAVGVTGYLITESATTPLAGAAGWVGTAPTSYTAVGTGSVTLYAWAKDAAGNVSAAATATVTITSGLSENFESGTLNGWATGTPAFTISSVAPISGAYSAYITYTSGATPTAYIQKSVPLTNGKTISVKYKTVMPIEGIGDGNVRLLVKVDGGVLLDFPSPPGSNSGTLSVPYTGITGTHTLQIAAQMVSNGDGVDITYTETFQVWFDDITY